MLFRVVALVLLAYVSLDFADPSLPGVFFFESDQLFVDGMVPDKSDGDTAKPEVIGSPLRSVVALRPDAVPAVQALATRAARRYTLVARSTIRPRSEPSSPDADPLA